MPSKSSLAVLGAASILVVVAALGPANAAHEAAHMITGKNIKNNSVTTSDIKNNNLTSADVKNNSLTGADINENTLGNVPSATKLAALGHGQSESGAFGLTAPASTYGNGAVTFPRPLGFQLLTNHIIDTVDTPDATHCPGVGHAAAGYMCLYFDYYDGTSDVYGYPEHTPYSDTHPFIGLDLFAYFTSAGYADGIYTVTEP